MCAAANTTRPANEIRPTNRPNACLMPFLHFPSQESPLADAFEIMDSRSRALENRDGIDGRPRASCDRRRRDDQQEFPPFEAGSRFGKRLEVQIVEDVHSEGSEGDAVDGIREARNRGTSVLVRVAAEHCYIAFLQERHKRGVVTYLIQEGSDLGPAGPAAGPKQHGVTGHYL